MGQDETLIPIDLTSGKGFSDYFKENMEQIGFARFIPNVALVETITAAVQAGANWVTKTFLVDSSGKMHSLKVYNRETYDGLSKLNLPLYAFTAEEIFKGNILLFNVNFFEDKGKEIWVRLGNGKPMTLSDYLKNKQRFATGVGNAGRWAGANSDITGYFYYDDDGNEVNSSKSDIAIELGTTISQWYNALRNIAIVLMLSILLYIGIRMLLSSVAQDKAKYKQMLTDWFVGMCLLFFMHYIMAFSVTLTEQFVKIVKSTTDNNITVAIQEDTNKYLSKGLEECGYDNIQKQDDYILWNTNLLGELRIACQMSRGNVSYIGYAICFLVLVFYTVFFAFTYLKRVLYMAFLTIIAPMVAMTYPIDKINDGQAQGFNKWLKEYLFNLLIQPVHLILYTMLVSSALELAQVNVWYMIVAIGFIVPAEKLLRSLFGFEKATTPGSFAGAAVGAGLISQGLGRVLGGIPGGKGRNGRSGGDDRKLGSGEEDDHKIKKMKMKDDNLDDSSTAMLNGFDSDKSDNSKPLNINADNVNIQPKAQEGEKRTLKPNANAMSRLGTNVNTIKKPNANAMSRLGTNVNTQKKPSTNNNSTKQESKNKNLSNKPKIGLKSGRRPRKALRVARAGARQVFRGKNLRKLARAGGNLGKSAIRFTGKAAGAALAGSIGVAAGIASGDPSNALQYGLTAGVAGAAAGGAVADGAMNTIGGVANGISDGISEFRSGDVMTAMNEEYYGKDEWEEKQREKAIKEWKKDDEKRAELEREIGYNEVAEMYKNNEIDEYLNYGIDDAKEIKKMHKLNKDDVKVEEYLKRGIDDAKDIETLDRLQKQGDVKDIDQAVALHSYSQRIGDTTKLDEDKKAKWHKTFKNEFVSKNGRSDAQAEKATVKTMEMLDKFNKTKNSIKD